MNNFISNFSGEQVDDVISRKTYIQLTSGTYLNDVKTPGLYGASNGTLSYSIKNKPVPGAGGTPGFTLLVCTIAGSSTTRIVQFLLYNNEVGIFKRTTTLSDNTNWQSWERCNFYSTDVVRIGTTSQRPTVLNMYDVGFVYIDTTLNKPIFYTGDTSDNKTGWVDATGANV